MAAPEFELTPPEPILYLCKWCLDAGPEHLDTQHDCQKAWATASNIGQQKCECPCGKIYANRNRLLIYCKALRIHAARADDAMRRARNNERAEMKSRRYYQTGYNVLSLRSEEWLDSERSIACLRNEIEEWRQTHKYATDELRQQRDRYARLLQANEQQAMDIRALRAKASAYDKLMEPMETTKGRHIILDDEP